MPADPNNPVILFRDFTPGIADNPSVRYPAEQAQRTNTYRCIANRAGALTPLPRQDASYNGIDYLGANPAAGYYVINGFFVPLYTVVPETSSDPSDPDSRIHPIFLSVSYVTAATFTEKLELFRMWDNPHTNTSVRIMTAAAGSVTGAGGVGASFGLTRANRAAPTTPGVPVVVFSWANLVPFLAVILIYPDDSTPTVESHFDISTAIFAAVMTVHQGRIVIASLTGYGFGAQGVGSTSENLYWTNVGDPGTLSTVQSFVPEDPNGYFVLYSMSANELFCLKQHGAVMLSGDLNNPTVVNLPMVVGSSIAQTPTPSPLGLVYGSEQSGVWVWQHGDSSTLISPQMDPDFWMVPNEILEGIRYTFAIWDDWIIVPNNFVFDTQSKSWWRLEDESLVQITKYGRYNKFLYGAKRTYTHENPTAFYSWRKDQGATSYSWQSHPLWESVDRQLAVREIELIAKGKGTVTLTLTGLNNVTKSTTITLDNTGFPERHRVNFSIHAMNIQLRIEADSGTATDNAPTVYEVILYPHERQRVALS